MPSLLRREEKRIQSSPRDADTEDAVIANLREASVMTGNSVRCECRNGMLVLSGTLPSYYRKQLAQERAGRIDGVNVIINQIRVDNTPKSPAKFNA